MCSSSSDLLEQATFIELEVWLLLRNDARVVRGAVLPTLGDQLESKLTPHLPFAQIPLDDLPLLSFVRREQGAADAWWMTDCFQNSLVVELEDHLVRAVKPEIAHEVLGWNRFVHAVQLHAALSPHLGATLPVNRIDQGWWNEDFVVVDGAATNLDGLLVPQVEQIMLRILWIKLLPTSCDSVRRSIWVFDHGMSIYCMNMSFRKFVEEAEEVLKMIQASPNHQAKIDSGVADQSYWDKYRDRWGVHGEFVEMKMPVSYLVNLIDNERKMYISKYDDKEVQAKQMARRFNKVIITRSTSSGAPVPLVVVDGTHSLVAAARNKEAEIDVIISRDALTYLGISPK